MHLAFSSAPPACSRAELKRTAGERREDKNVSRDRRSTLPRIARAFWNKRNATGSPRGVLRRNLLGVANAIARNGSNSANVARLFLYSPRNYYNRIPSLINQFPCHVSSRVISAILPLDPRSLKSLYRLEKNVCRPLDFGENRLHSTLKCQLFKSVMLIVLYR